MSIDKYTVLRGTFGCRSFRPGQAELIDSVLSRRDTFGILPTGGGKSLCYQIPALLLPGITLVISPLISLMEDQVSALKKRGIPAEAVSSAVPAPERRSVYENGIRKRIKILYLAPERLSSKEFAEIAPRLDISMICVDEAHCVSQWGREFRPSYRDIAAFADQLPRRPVVAAFTATAAPRVRADIIRLLRLRNPFVLVTGFDRPNLYYGVMHPKNKYDTLKVLLQKYEGKTGVIYCGTRNAAESAAAQLRADGIPAVSYHAGMKTDERSRNQEHFLSGKTKIICATSAFGMGIDKPDVRFVIHLNMPGDIESYYQEAGRAGRDGLPSDCILLAAPRDIELRNSFIKSTKDPELRKELRANLAGMRRLASGRSCLRGVILSWFGENVPGKCGHCSFCRGEIPGDDFPPEGMVYPVLLHHLTDLRLQIAREHRTAPYKVLTDRNLIDLAARRPESIRDFMGIEGISAISAIKYGADFVSEIRACKESSL